jgi:hypothetical protein
MQRLNAFTSLLQKWDIEFSARIDELGSDLGEFMLDSTNRFLSVLGLRCDEVVATSTLTSLDTMLFILGDDYASKMARIFG